MKKIFLFSLFIVCSLFFISNSYAQGNLQFNQVLVLDVYSNNSLNLPSTVPIGKVWKIESALSTSTSGWIRLNGAQITTNSGSVTPFWLPPGYSVTFTTTNSVEGKISIIEFNIIP
jgi:hypothetical protein